VTPSARVAAAIQILDRILAQDPPEAALTGWARGSRYAGSGDRAAVRDLVFDALRCRRSFAALAGAAENAPTGRDLLIGRTLAEGIAPDMLFTGEGHAPAALSEAELARIAVAPGLTDLPLPVWLDCPDWLVPPLQASLGDIFAPALAAQRHRAKVTLRVNAAHLTRTEAARRMEVDGVQTAPHPLADTALTVTAGASRIRASAPYLDGSVELQDAASQAAAALVPVQAGDRVLDYCAGGGGKTLALAARVPSARFFAHDTDPARMRDLPPRAERAGCRVTLLDTPAARAQGPFDLVVVDAPCSGSGTWARNPQAKWDLTPDRLTALCALQSSILTEAAALIRPGGALAYMTCSMLNAENAERVDDLLTHRPDWTEDLHQRFTPDQGGDGFFVSILHSPA
jgi:16S rRNA (cytosine967-C5)-methyltransferase